MLVRTESETARDKRMSEMCWPSVIVNGVSKIKVGGAEEIEHVLVSWLEGRLAQSEGT